MTPTSVKPMKKKIETVLKMEQPQNQTRIRVFLGAVTFYRTLWTRRSYRPRGIPSHFAIFVADAMSTYPNNNSNDNVPQGIPQHAP